MCVLPSEESVVVVLEHHHVGRFSAHHRSPFLETNEGVLFGEDVGVFARACVDLIDLDRTSVTLPVTTSTVDLLCKFARGHSLVSSAFEHLDQGFMQGQSLG